jgi:hypothetical protein
VSGQVSTFRDASISFPHSITAGPDGALWRSVARSWRPRWCTTAWAAPFRSADPAGFLERFGGWRRDRYGASVRLACHCRASTGGSERSPVVASGRSNASLINVDARLCR